MTRWSLRRHKHRTTKPVTGTYRLDPVQPDSFPPEGYRQPEALPPSAFTPGGYQRNAYDPGAAQPFDPMPFAAGAPTRSDARLTASGPLNPASIIPEHALPVAGGAWPEVMEQFGLNLLVLAEQLRISLDELESDEDDSERLQKLYKVDHAVTRIRRASRDLRILGGRAEEEIAGIDTSLLDVVRMALSAIERYTQVSIGRVADLAVLGYATDDVASLLAALLDNATRYSPGMATVSAHLTGDGSVLFRVEDSGIGMAPESVASLNAMLAGEVPDLDDRTGRHTGFPVVHRIARRYGMSVRLAAKPSPGSGTIALVAVPPELLCELPLQPLARPEAPPKPHSRESRISVLPTARRAPAAEPPEPPELGNTASPGDAMDQDDKAGRLPGSLPRRERASLRGDRPGRTGGGRREDAAPAPSPQERSAARYAFADDLAAFSLGGQDSAEKGTTP
jgi:hypothetical protein